MATSALYATPPSNTQKYWAAIFSDSAAVQALHGATKPFLAPSFNTALVWYIISHADQYQQMEDDSRLPSELKEAVHRLGGKPVAGLRETNHLEGITVVRLQNPVPQGSLEPMKQALEDAMKVTYETRSKGKHTILSRLTMKCEYEAQK